MQISFYVLSDDYVSSGSVSSSTLTPSPRLINPNEVKAETAALLDFVCQLTQTVLKKSDLSLVIVDDDERLALLDKWLWEFDTTSFIPHTLIPNLTTPSSLASAASNTSNHPHKSRSTCALPTMTDLVAPVMLSSQMPLGFDGVVLNLAATPLSFASSKAALSQLSHASSQDTGTPPQTELSPKDTNSSTSHAVLPQRILEVIAPNDVSRQQGRTKYRHYKAQGFTLKHFPISK